MGGDWEEVEVAHLLLLGKGQAEEEVEERLGAVPMRAHLVDVKRRLLGLPTHAYPCSLLPSPLVQEGRPLPEVLMRRKRASLRRMQQRFLAQSRSLASEAPSSIPAAATSTSAIPGSRGLLMAHFAPHFRGRALIQPASAFE